MEEAASLWTETGYLDTRSDVGCLLSIGTGMANVTRMESDTIVKAITSKVRKPLQAVEVMKKIATATEPIHRNVARRFDPSSGVYQRFNVDQGIQAVKLFDHEKREEIEVDTTAYMQKHSVHWQLSQAVDIMKNIGIRELMADRDESEQIYSTGDGGVDEELKLKQRLEALRM